MVQRASDGGRPPVTKRPAILNGQNGVAVAGGVVAYVRRVIHGRQLTEDFVVELVTHIFKGDFMHPHEAEFSVEPPANSSGVPMSNVSFAT